MSTTKATEASMLMTSGENNKDVIIIDNQEEWKKAFLYGHAAILFHSNGCGPCSTFIPMWLALAHHYSNPILTPPVNTSINSSTIGGKTEKGEAGPPTTRYRARADWQFYSALNVDNEELMTDLGVFGVPQVMLILCPHNQYPHAFLDECLQVTFDGITRMVFLLPRIHNSEYLSYLKPWFLTPCTSSCRFHSQLHSDFQKEMQTPSLHRKYLEAPAATKVTSSSFSSSPSTGSLSLGVINNAKQPTNASGWRFNAQWMHSSHTLFRWLTFSNPLLTINSPVTRDTVKNIESSIHLIRDPVGYWSSKMSKHYI